MKNLTKISLVLAIIMIFTGCDDGSQKTKNTDTSVNRGINVYCDKEKGVEYLIFKGHKSGGMTIRTNADGSVSKCPRG